MGQNKPKSQQAYSKVTSTRGQSDRHLGWRARAGFGFLILCGIGLFVLTIFRRSSKHAEDAGLSRMVERSPSSESARPLTGSPTDAEIRTAANQLFWAVNPSLPENQYFTPLAKRKLSWIITQKATGKLSLILLKNVDSAGLIADDLMASGRPEGKPVIVISQPSFLDFLLDGGRIAGPFSQQQKNDFAIGLVHRETPPVVHNPLHLHMKEGGGPTVSSTV